MRNLLRSLPALALLAVPTAPVDAAVGQMTCVLDYAVYGAGATTARGTCTVVGTYTATLTMNLTADLPAATCPLTESASGTLTGPGLQAGFTWTRVGTSGYIVYAPPYTMQGPGTFVVTSPLGNPCGAHNVTVTATLPLP